MNGDPISIGVLEAVESRLREISVANGYRTSPKILLGVETVSENDLPAIVVWEAAEEATKADGATMSMDLALTLQLDCLDLAGPGCTAKLARLRADVKRALLRREGLVGDDGTKFGLLIYRGMQRLERPAGSTVSGCAISVAAKIREGYGDPSTTR